ncbi:hypothetical protein NEMBOFW57_003355 [Staphylotrichum longicolle]|uniref:N-acetyltransferase domain-containing protein n=1 Tax=Staphylotrichum longicolle TaxID=669026 RepID=A0AAD4F545_9PEZI|nr:hypothetical protein NEMBOFW57_003355 [Staphylotrichum longicolle]
MAAAPASSSAPRPAAGPEPDPSTFIRVRTTLPRRPFPPNATRQPITTERLTLRVLTQDDLAALHELRTQPEVMIWTALGKPDKDLAETQAKLDPFLPPRDEATFNFAICDRATGQMIGIGGCHLWRSAFGWPEVGYMLRKEFWGKGLGTEFLRGFLTGVREQLIAVTATGNDKSQGVLGKAGFKWFTTWLAEDLQKGTGPGSMIELPTFRYFPGGKKGE